VVSEKGDIAGLHFGNRRHDAALDARRPMRCKALGLSRRGDVEIELHFKRTNGESVAGSPSGRAMLQETPGTRNDAEKEIPPSAIYSRAR
jgi:hypothetical protein